MGIAAEPRGVTVEEKVTDWPAKAGLGKTVREVVVGRAVMRWLSVMELPAKEPVGT